MRLDVLKEIDGPMLQHGLQGFQESIHGPVRRPLQAQIANFLAERYALFPRAS